MSERRRAGKKRGGRRGRHLFLKTVLCLLILAVLTAGYARYIEPKMLIEKTETYQSEKLTVLPNGVKIAIFADTHFSEYYTPEDFKKVTEKINRRTPDFIFFLGDLIDDFSTYKGDIREVETALASLKAKVAKIAVFGNHDYGGEMEIDYPDVMEAGGFQLLVNEKADFDEFNMTILGIDDVVIGYGDPSFAASLTDDRYNIAICHEPDVADELKTYSVDLMLSGHTHGRQINLRLFDDYILPAYGKKYIKGRYTLPASDGSDLSLYVTGGIGMTKLPLRFASPPEVNMIDLNKFPES